MGIPASNVKYLALSVLVEALGTAKTRYVACPVSGYVREVHYAVDVAVDANNAMTSEIAGTAITGGGVTLTTSETAGLSKIAVPTAAYTVRKGQLLSATTDGGGGAGQCRVTFLIEQE